MVHVFNTGMEGQLPQTLRDRKSENKKGKYVIAEFTEGPCICPLSFVCFPSVQLLFLMFSDLAALCNYCLPSAGYLDLASCAHTFVSIERAVQTIFAFGVPGAGLSIVLVLFSSCSGLVLVLQTGSKLCDGIYFI